MKIFRICSAALRNAKMSLNINLWCVAHLYNANIIAPSKKFIVALHIRSGALHHATTTKKNVLA
jgi:hypothetical protein